MVPNFLGHPVDVADAFHKSVVKELV